MESDSTIGQNSSYFYDLDKSSNQNDSILITPLINEFIPVYRIDTNYVCSKDDLEFDNEIDALVHISETHLPSYDENFISGKEKAHIVRCSYGQCVEQLCNKYLKTHLKSHIQERKKTALKKRKFEEKAAVVKSLTCLHASCTGNKPLANPIKFTRHMVKHKGMKRNSDTGKLFYPCPVLGCQTMECITLKAFEDHLKKNHTQHEYFQVRQ